MNIYKFRCKYAVEYPCRFSMGFRDYHCSTNIEWDDYMRMLDMTRLLSIFVPYVIVPCPNKPLLVPLEETPITRLRRRGYEDYTSVGNANKDIQNENNKERNNC